MGMLVPVFIATLIETCGSGLSRHIPILPAFKSDNTHSKEFHIIVNALPKWPLTQLGYVPLCPYESTVEEFRLI